MSTTWWDSEDFRQVADSLGQFTLEYGFGPGYLRLAAVDNDDQWARRLRHLGRLD